MGYWLGGFFGVEGLDKRIFWVFEGSAGEKIRG